MASPSSTLPAKRLHLLAMGLDMAGLLLLLVQARVFVPAEQADPRILWLALCAPLISLVLFAVVPRRYPVAPGTKFPRRSLPVYLNLGAPVVITLLTLLLVGISGSFDSFSGFALLVGVDAGRNLREWLRLLVLERE